jgi:hypothetical protein
MRLYPLLVGLLLGAMQTALYFQLTFTLSSSFGTYLLVTLCWLLGSAFGVLAAAKTAVPTHLYLLAALLAYGAVCLLLSAAPFRTEWWPLYGALVAVNGGYAGVFFGRMSSAYTARALLLTENNGFIVGLALTTLLFLTLGRVVLWLAPALLALVIALISEPDRVMKNSPNEEMNYHDGKDAKRENL